MKKSIQSRKVDLDPVKKPTQSREIHPAKKPTLPVPSSIVLNAKKQPSTEKTRFPIIEIPDEEDDVDKYDRLKELVIDFSESMIRISTIRHPKIRAIIKDWNQLMKNMKNLDEN